MSYPIFKYLFSSLQNCHSLDELKCKLLEFKVVDDSSIIKDMDENQLKNYVYTGDYEVKNFEGVAKIFTCIFDNDVKSLIKYIMKVNMPPPSILRVMIFCLKNTEVYSSSPLYKYLIHFKNNRLKKFDEMLEKLGMLRYIDKLDLLSELIKLL